MGEKTFNHFRFYSAGQYLYTFFDLRKTFLITICSIHYIYTIWFGFFIQWYINPCGLFNAKAILVEE